LYSYDDFGCHPTNSSPTESPSLKFLKDAADFFPPNYKRHSLEINFHGTLYCDAESNTLILAFRGSVALTRFLDQNQVNDWFNTNFLQHLGDRPLQYEMAEDAADRIEFLWNMGRFDDECGLGHPTFLLTGHSKGGGQAQFAAIRTKQRAIVFNSDIANPVIFTDWMMGPQSNIIARRIQSIRGCVYGQFQPNLLVHVAYLTSGRVKDVRLVNDPLTDKLFTLCGGNLPHAPIEWLINTMSCSDNGHAIETVFHELRMCAATR
jgi:hypothetical protein